MLSVSQQLGRFQISKQKTSKNVYAGWRHDVSLSADDVIAKKGKTSKMSIIFSCLKRLLRIRRKVHRQSHLERRSHLFHRENSGTPLHCHKIPYFSLQNS